MVQKALQRDNNAARLNVCDEQPRIAGDLIKPMSYNKFLILLSESIKGIPKIGDLDGPRVVQPNIQFDSMRCARVRAPQGPLRRSVES